MIISLYKVFVWENLTDIVTFCDRAHERTPEVNDRIEIGHWEGDLMHFGKRTQVNSITLRDRHSRYIIAVKNSNREAKSTAGKIINALDNLKIYKVKSPNL